jgi:transposase
MSYIKTDKRKSGTYLRIVESKRNSNGKVQKTTLHNLGNVANYSSASLKKMGKVLYELGGGRIPEEYTPRISEIARYNYGFIQVYDHVIKEYELDKYLCRLSLRYHIEFDLYQTILLMIAERLNDPSSKLSNYNHQNEYLGLDKIELHNLYRSLDYLYENQDKIQQLIYTKGRNLFNQQLDVVFYDVTTFYFDSEKEDGYRRKGYSKDGKIGKTVIVFGLLIDKHKNPIGYRIYKGGQYEGHTFADAVRKLREEYSIDRVITVADRGMMSRENISLLNSESIGYEYIIGERLKNLSHSLQDKILDRSKYSKLKIREEEEGKETEEEIELEYFVIKHEGKKIITTYSSKRASKDRYEREEKIKKAKQYLEDPSKVERKAASHYLKKKNKSEYEIDEEKIKKSERYDGFISISTNAEDMSETDILDAYKQLYKIEHTFRTFKSYLETRPMFHWTEKRIEGHLCLCYISFTLLNYLQQQLQKRLAPMSENKIRNTLSQLQLSLINLDGKEYYLRSNTGEGGKMIFKALKIKELPNLIPKHELTNYISKI